MGKAQTPALRTIFDKLADDLQAVYERQVADAAQAFDKGLATVAALAAMKATLEQGGVDVTFDTYATPPDKLYANTFPDLPTARAAAALIAVSHPGLAMVGVCVVDTASYSSPPEVKVDLLGPTGALKAYLRYKKPDDA